MPTYAHLPLRALSEVEAELAEDDDEARKRLDEAFARFEQTQAALADRIGQVLAGPLDETALALGYFLTLAIWLAFDNVFHDDLGEVNAMALSSVEESLKLDEQLRMADPAEAVDSDDVIAMEQPDVLAFVHEHVDAALEANAGEVNVDDVHEIYRIILIEILALSYAVRPPANWGIQMSNEFTA